MRLLLAVLLLAATALPALAEGRVLSADGTAAVTLHRALAYHEGTREVLVQQVRFTASDGRPVAWIFPCPEPRALGSLATDRLFASLEQGSVPKVVRVGWMLETGFFVFFSVFTLVQGFRRKSLREATPWVAASLCAAALWLSLSNQGTRGVAPPDVTGAAHASVLELATVPVADADGLTSWLKERGFALDPAGRDAAAAAFARGWRVVCATISPGAEGGACLTEPVAVAFDAPAPMLPLAMAAAAEPGAELIAYVFADHRVEGDVRVRTESAAKRDGNVVPWAFAEAKPAALWSQTGLSRTETRFLTRLRGTAAAEGAGGDLVFQMAAEDKAWRKRTYQW